MLGYAMLKCKWSPVASFRLCTLHFFWHYLHTYRISDVASRQHLRFARRHYLVVPRQSTLVWASGICWCR